MSKIKTISYGKSFEVVTPIGTVWEKIGLEAELGERETAEEGMIELKQFVDFFHSQYSGQEIPPQDTFTTVPGNKKQPVKLAPDDSIRLEFALASSKGDEQKVQSLLNIYDFNAPRKQNNVHQIPTVNA